MPDPKNDHPTKNAGTQPRTDLPPTKKPYQDDYFGTGEEEGVVREREASGDDDGPQAA